MRDSVRIMEQSKNLDSQNGSYAQGWSRTEVGRPVAVWLSILFCAGLVGVPLVDGILGSWREPAAKAKAGIVRIAHCFSKGGPWWEAIVDANNAALVAIKSFEASLEDSSAIGSEVRPTVLDGLLNLGGAGSEEAYVGRGGWLFYRPDVDALVMSASGGDGTARGIAGFAAQLAARGIRLVVVPIPGKASIHPEKIASGEVTFAAPLVPAVLSGLPGDLAAAWREGKAKDPSMAPWVVDPTEMLWLRKNSSGADQFLRTDSHWTPAAMQAVARMVARVVVPMSGGVLPENLTVEKRAVSAVGDTALMHALPASSLWLQPQNVEIEIIRGGDGAVWQPDRNSPVLVLGDSYSNIYSAEDLGWGGSAGFAEHLSRDLGWRVDKLAQNNAGAKSAREMLAAESGRRPGWLSGKKVVVWVMAAREFVSGDWSDVRLPEVAGGGGLKFFAVPPGQTVNVTARVVAVGNVPESGDSPYADYLTAIHLADIEDAATGRQISGDALAYVFTMRNRGRISSAGLGVGQRIALRLSNYAEKADKLDSLNRGDLEDIEVMMQEPNFAEWIVKP